MSATAHANEAGSQPGASQQQAQTQPSGKSKPRRVKRTGSSTSGSQSFLPAAGGLVGAVAAAGAAAAGGSGSGDASPE